MGNRSLTPRPALSVRQSRTCRRSILSGTAVLWLPPGRCRLITGRTRANMPVSHQRRWASETMTGAESYDESAEESQYFLIKPDPRCPECAAIMVWRSAHRWIAITNRAEIKLSLRVGRSPPSHAGRAGCSPQEPHAAATQGTGKERTLAPGGVARSCSSPVRRSRRAGHRPS